MEAMEDELRVGPADGDGAGAGGIHDVGGCTWSWEALVHPHEKVELIGAQTIRKYDL
jgi:hypothetical protein